jgi:hypothetical protein
MTRAGFPPTRLFGGTSFVTTEPAATTEFSPTVTPPMIVAPVAIQTFAMVLQARDKPRSNAHAFPAITT